MTLERGDVMWNGLTSQSSDARLCPEDNVGDVPETIPVGGEVGQS